MNKYRKYRLKKFLKGLELFIAGYCAGILSAIVLIELEIISIT